MAILSKNTSSIPVGNFDITNKENGMVKGESAKEDDTEAMIALKDGDDSALTEIMNRWREPITSFIYRTIGDYETALDLAQEVFVRLYRNRMNYQPNGSFSSYIFTIAANLSKNHFRWKGRHPEAPLEASFSESRQSESGNPLDYLEKSEESIRIKKALLQLPEKLRIPVILFYYQDLSQSEIATILNCSEKTVETRLYRARGKLKQLLGSAEK